MSNILPYLCLGGVEIANPCRTKAYVRRTSAPKPHGLWSWRDECGDCCCADFDDGPYSLPSTDGAPWADTDRPETDEFFGVYIRQIEMTTPVARLGPTDQTSGRLVMNKRTLTVTADIVASSVRGSAYGMQWLSQALLDASECGPNGCTDVGIIYVSCDTVTGNGARRLYGLGLVSIDDTTTDDGTFPPSAGREVTFVLEAEIPWLFGMDDQECFFLSRWNLDPVLNNTDCEAVWTDWLNRICEVDIVTAVSPADQCALPVDCRPASAPIIKPTPLNTCFCEPIYSAIQCCSTGPIPDWSQAVLTFVVNSGSEAMRNARIKVWQNPKGYACPSDVTPGDPAWQYWNEQVPVSSLEITYMPPNSTLTIDGKLGTITLSCKGFCFDADSYVTGPNATAWQDPVVECVTGELCACMYVDAAHTAIDANMSISVTRRTLW